MVTLSTYLAPINGAYLGQMLEKGGGFADRIFPKGLVLSQNYLNPVKWHTHSLLLYY